jgi:hypothetical protein
MEREYVMKHEKWDKGGSVRGATVYASEQSSAPPRWSTLDIPASDEACLI